VNIAVASGKGGTGKTTVATNVAAVSAARGQPTAYLDCDVEEPNGHLFLKPEIVRQEPVGLPIPVVDESRCNHCGRCGKICQYSAIVCIGQKVLVYPELCHACGGCMLVCPEDAISETDRPVGTLEIGHAGAIQFVHGLMNIGEAMSPPLIRAVRSNAPDVDLVVIDAPPGTSCPVIESVRGTDFVMLVTEPTPFGLHDLKLAVEMVHALDLPFGVVINRAGLGDDSTHRFCNEKNIKILAEIPDDRELAVAYSRGEMITEALPAYRALFEQLLASVLTEASAAAEQRIAQPNTISKP